MICFYIELTFFFFFFIYLFGKKNSNEDLEDTKKIAEKILFSSICDFVYNLNVVPGKILLTPKNLYFFVDRKQLKPNQTISHHAPKDSKVN